MLPAALGAAGELDREFEQAVAEEAGEGERGGEEEEEWDCWDLALAGFSLSGLWERIVKEGGVEGTPESLRQRIRMLKEAKVHDPRDGTSW